VATRDPQAEVFLERWPELTPIALKARALIFDVMPDGIEQVKTGWSVIQYGPTGKMRDVSVVLQPQRAWVNLGLADGATLPDPAGLLEGTGKGIRHVKLRRPEDVENPAVRALVAAQVGASAS
jgi:hypothetical protein